MISIKLTPLQAQALIDAAERGLFDWGALIDERADYAGLKKRRMLAYRAVEKVQAGLGATLTRRPKT